LIQTDIPAVQSPYAGRRLTIWQHLAISCYWFGSNVLWGAMLVMLLPEAAQSITSHNMATLPPVPEGETLRHWIHGILTDKGKAIGIIGSMVAFVSLAVPLIAGALSDRCASRWGRRRPYIVVGTLVSLLALVGMAASVKMSSFWGFLVSYCTVALGNNIATAAYSGVIPDLVPEDQRGIASGYMAMMSSVGTLVGAFASGFLLTASTLAAYAFVILGVGLFAVLTVVGVREIPLAYKPAPIRWGEYLRSLWIDPRKYPDFAWVWITRFLVMLGFYSIEPYINYYLHDVVGVRDPRTATPVLLGLILIGATASGVYGGVISERVGRKRVVYVSNVIMAVMCLALMMSRSLPVVLFFGVIFGLGYGAYISVDWALGTDVLPSKEHSGKDMAVWHISMTLPQSITPLIAGYWLLSAFPTKMYVSAAGERTTQYAVEGYVLVFVMAAVFFILGAVLLKNVKKAR